jgi:PAS domain S-box-containing protein
VVITRLTDESGKIIGFSKITRDLSEKQQYNIDTTRQNYFQQFVKGIKDYAIFLLDKHGTVATWNEGASRIHGYNPEEIIGLNFKHFYPINLSEKALEDLNTARAQHRFEEEGWKTKKDGTVFWANTTLTPLFDSQGQITGFCNIIQDLTLKKITEEKLKVANDELEKKVLLRTHELSKAKAELEQALQVRDDFLSIASHELKTPITSLRLQAQMLKAKLKTTDSSDTLLTDKTKNAVNIIMKQADRLTSLIEDLLDVSRVQIGKLSFNFQQTNLSKLLNEISERWKDQLQSAGCSLEKSIEESVEAYIDPFRIELDDVGEPIRLRATIQPKHKKGRNKWYLEKIELVKYTKQNQKPKPQPKPPPKRTNQQQTTPSSTPKKTP